MANNMIKRVEVLSFTDNKGVEQLFKKDSLVTIKEFGTFGSEYTGRIDYIDTVLVRLDVSKEYKHKTVDIRYEHICNIETYTPKEAWINMQRTEGLEI